jgi:hypothetical protein
MMICANFFFVFFISVEGFQFHKSSTIGGSIRQNGISTQFPFRLFAKPAVQIEVQRKSFSIGIEKLFKIFLQASLEKKIIVLAYPLTVILLYLLFTSTLVTVHFESMMSSMSSLIVKSMHKTSQKVSKLTESFAKAKSADEKTNEEKIASDSLIEQAILATDALIAQAKKEIEAKLLFIAQSEEKVKLQKAEEEAKQMVADANADALLIKAENDFRIVAEAEQIRLNLLFTVEEKDTASLNIPSNASVASKSTTSGADATVAMFFILVLGSPLFQVLQQLNP